MSTIKSKLRSEAKESRKRYNNLKSCEEEFIKSSFYINSDCLLLYYSIGSEADTLNLINQALIDKKNVFLPRVDGDDLIFLKITDLNHIESGYFGIMEPSHGEIYNGQNAVCVVPGLAFDRSGNRLGYGKGFYDRFLSKNTHLIKIGFCLGCSFYDNIPTIETDISMNYIFVDQSLYCV